MPTWRKKGGDGQSIYYYLCERCNERLDDSLIAQGWSFLRDGEPVSCSVCALRCQLTAQGLWGAEDAVRYRVCSHCEELSSCALKGRYFC